MSENYLVISDLQIPFEAPKALQFCLYLKRHYKIPDDNVLNVGDELDCYHGGRWPKDPNGHYSATGELAAAKATLKEWYAAFPKMKLAISNHGLRWVRKASAAEIPNEMLRSYQEIIEAPKGWVWKDEWRFNTKHPFRMIHGMGYGGVNAHRTAAMDAGMSTVIGHIHSYGGISQVRTRGMRIWGMNAGCLIDWEAYAFEYGRENRFHPTIGAGIIANNGSTPIWLPHE